MTNAHARVNPLRSEDNEKYARKQNRLTNIAQGQNETRRRIQQLYSDIHHRLVSQHFVRINRLIRLTFHNTLHV